MGRACAANMPEWRLLGGGRLAPAPFFIAGIVNVTPDSFSDGGRFLAPESALAHARRQLEEGAHILDLGAESTRPGAEDIGPDEEIKRLDGVLPALLALRDAAGVEKPFVVSIDTYRAKTTTWCLERGVDIINDVSGAVFEPEIIDALVQFKPGYVLGHSPERPAEMQKNPYYDNVVEELLRYFDERINTLVKAGLPEECIAVDPCIGFGKTVEHCLEIMAAAERFAIFGRPLFFGISRKSFIGAVAGYPVEERDMHTQVATALLAEKGVHIHRVHNVGAAKGTLALVEKLADLKYV